MNTAPEATTIDTPATDSANDAEYAEMLKMAEASDAGKPIEQPAKSTPTSTEKPDGKPAEQGDDEKAKAEAARIESEKANAQAKPGTKPESAYTKAQKEQARLDESWKKLNAEKEALRKDPEFQEYLRQKKERALGKPADTAAKPKRPYTAADMEAVAKQYQDEGNDKMAVAARERAAELLKEEQAEALAAKQAPSGDHRRTPEFQQDWAKNFQEVAATEPELQKEGSPLEQTVFNLVNNPEYAPFFRALPKGIKYAVEIAKMMREAHGAKGLQEKLKTTEGDLTKAKAEVERLTQLTALGGSLPAITGKGRGLADMSGDEADAEILRLAKAADRGGT